MAELNENAFAEANKINFDLFWEKVDQLDGPPSCWNWIGAKDESGYGRFHIGLSNNSTMLSHRVAYGLKHGSLPEAVCHHCDNPSCCNQRALAKRFGVCQRSINKAVRGISFENVRAS